MPQRLGRCVLSSFGLSRALLIPLVLLDGERDAAAEADQGTAPAGGVLAAIAADPQLTPRQKSALREIYLSLRGQEGETP